MCDETPVWLAWDHWDLMTTGQGLERTTFRLVVRRTNIEPGVDIIRKVIKSNLVALKLVLTRQL